MLHCDRAGGSQLSAAVRFLKAHHNKGEVPLITVDIGANDVDGCVTATERASAASRSGLDSIAKNVPKILASLKKAAPAGTTFAAMNLYDPVLGGYFAPVGTTATHARDRVVAAGQSSSTRRSPRPIERGGFLTADVADAFDTYNNTTTVDVGVPADPAQRGPCLQLDVGLPDAAQRPEHPREQERLSGDRQRVREGDR